MRETRLLRRCAAVVLLLIVQPAMLAAQTLVLAEGVSSLVRGPLVFGDSTFLFATIPTCSNLPGDEVAPALISRGSPFLIRPRTIFSFNPARPEATCNPYRLLSDIVSDGQFLYYVDNLGPDGHAALWRRDRFANPGDASQLLYDLGASFNSAEITLFQSVLFAILRRPGNFDAIAEFDKATGALIEDIVDFGAVDGVTNIQQDGRYLYWLSSGALRRNDLTNGERMTVLPGPITTYYNEGYDEICGPGVCLRFSRVLFSQGNVLYEAETIGGGEIPLYTSPDPNASITAITRDGTRVYFIERRAVGGGFDREDRVYRLPIGNTTPALIYGPVNNGGPGFDGFSTDLQYLYFRDRQARTLLSLPNDAAAIPVHDVAATRLEVTQGLQNAANELPLIENKRTLVRFFVRSNIAGEDVPGVGAVLQGSNQRGFLGTLDPINPGSKLITARHTPQRVELGHSFQFELPRSWTTGGALTLTATVNPSGRTVEDNDDNNSASLGPITFEPSPWLHVGYINFAYTIGNTTYAVSDAERGESQRYMRRLYPLGEPAPGAAFGSPGLQFTIVNIDDFGLGAHVQRTAELCLKRRPKVQDRNQCASDYVHAEMGYLFYKGFLRDPAVYYANIPQAPAPPGSSYFTRGYAGGRLASGPSDDRNYAAHEVGHVLGRAHPSPGSASCGHSASDPSYPYFGSYLDEFGFSSTRYAGLDFADTLPGALSYLDATSYFDTMSYCSPNWISDYTYRGMLNFLRVDPLGIPPLGVPALRAGQRAAVPGDWLILSGLVDRNADRGAITMARRSDAVVDATPPEPGGFTLELRDSAGTVLGSYGFTGDDVEERDGELVFTVVVPFAAGTRELRVVEDMSSRTLATLSLSANAPTVGEVLLPDAPDPVDGVVRVSWSADDADGDALQFDVLASRDGGPFRPLLLNAEGADLQLDTAKLGGGSNRLRVLATDGVHAAYADSAPFTVPPRRPVVVITGPVDGYRADWGQLITFEAEVHDLQDEDFDDAGIVWSNQYGQLGSGRLLQTDALGVGENIVTLTATNSLGVSATASVTVVVGDRLVPLGPTLSVAPRTILWHIAGDVTAAQVSSLDVDNAGSDALTFDVTSDAPWLLVDSMQGASDASAPRHFIVSADPTLVPLGEISRATLTFQSQTDPNDVVTVAVSLARGNVFDRTGGEPPVGCAGDCDGNGSVAIDELVRGVGMALSDGSASQCAAMDRDGNDRIAINELVAAVGAALAGC